MQQKSSAAAAAAAVAARAPASGHEKPPPSQGECVPWLFFYLYVFFSSFQKRPTRQVPDFAQERIANAHRDHSSRRDVATHHVQRSRLPPGL